MKQTLKHILGKNEGYWMINKKLVHHIGLQETLLLQHLIDLEHSFFKNGGFYQQQDRMAKDLYMSERTVSNIIKKLSDDGLIRIEKGGMPRRNYYYINQVPILMIITDNEDDDTNP